VGRPGRLRVALFGLIVSAPVAATGAIPAHQATLDSLAAWHAASRPDRVDSLATAAIAGARQTGTDRDLAALLLARGRTRAAFGLARQAEPDLREALALAVATSDAMARLDALRWLSVALGQQGRAAEALRGYRDLEALAVAAGDSVHLGWAWVGRAFEHYGSGDPDSAIALYGRAAGVLDRSGIAKGAIWAWNGQALALRKAGRFPEAAAGFRRALAAARANQDGLNEAMALAHLGRLELHYGDPGQAERMLQHAVEIHERLRHAREVLLPRIDIAVARILQGRPVAAAALLDSVVVAARDQGLADLEILAANQLADVLLAEDRPGAAAALCRRSLARARDVSTLSLTETTLRLAQALADRDSSAAALAVLDAVAERGSGAESLRQGTAAARGQLLLSLGRPDEALVATGSAGSSGAAADGAALRIPVLTVRGRAWLACGRPDSARAAFAEAVALWEAARSLPEDPQWRERRSADAGELFAHAVAAELARPAGEPEAFTLLQRYKGRTLRERMVGPGRRLPDSTLAPSLGGLRRDVLTAGEVLLDVVQGRERGLLVCVTVDTTLTCDLAGSRTALPIVRRLEDALASRAVTDPAPARDLALALLADLSPAVRAQLAAARRLYWCPDGGYHRLPLALLTGDGGLLAADCALVTLPAASVLAQLRTSVASSPSPAVLAVHGQDPGGPGPLPGAAAETRRLAARLRHVRRLDGASPGARDSLAWRDAAVIHLAAHVTLDPEQPWQTRVDLGPGPRGRLRAADIAHQPISAQLAVLSGCRTAGTTVVGGEGLLGLASGFLAAGAPAVVATLWDVDDDAAARFVAAFYDALVTGEPPATALVRARERCRRHPATAAPRHWAGFVIVGDGSRPVPVEARRPLWPAALPLLAGAIFLFARLRRA